MNILTLFVCAISFAQQADIDVSVTKRSVPDNEPFNYQISVDCDCEIIAPDFNGFEVLNKQQGQFSSSQWINGKSSQQCTTTLTFTLRAKKQGRITIEPARVKCDGADGRSEEITIQVNDANEIHEENAGKVDFYYQLESNKSSVYVGEPFILTFSLYSENKPQEISGIIPGNAAGLWKKKLFEETEPGFRYTAYRKVVKGKEYVVIELRKEVCFADNPGNLHIEPYLGRAVKAWGFLDATYYEGYSNSIDIQVMEVPGQHPDDYYGLAGSFNLSHDISKTELQANRSLELEVKIEGTGNFHLMKNPDFNFPKHFLGADPDIQEDFSFNENGVTGSVTYSYELTPTKAGDYHFDSYNFSYFDLVSNRFRTDSIPAFTIHVSEGENPEIYSSVDVSQSEVENDIRHIHKGSLNSFTNDDFLYGSLFYWMLILIPPVFVLIFFLVKRNKSSKTADEHLKGQQKSVKRSVIKQLQKTTSSDPKAAGKEMKQLLEEYLMTQLNKGRSAMAKKTISDEFKAIGVDEPLRLTFEKIWDDIHMTQYAPTSSENIDDLNKSLQDLIKKLNKALK